MAILFVKYVRCEYEDFERERTKVCVRDSCDHFFSTSDKF